MPIKPKCPKLSQLVKMTPHWYSYSLKKGIATLKNKKAAGIDDVLVEQIKNLGPRTQRWLHSMPNLCFTENRGSKDLGLLVDELSGDTQSPANRDQLLS